MQSTLPMHIMWPNAIQRTPMCIENALALNNRSVVLTPRQIQLRCLKLCTSDGPFYFRGWEHSTAWVMCSVNHEWCVAAAESLYVMLGGGSLTSGCCSQC